MSSKFSWRKLETIGLVLVALHSFLVGAMLFFIPAWTLKFAGWEDIESLFFPRQSGAFHFVVAAGYVVEYFRYRSINLLMIAKTTAVLFLLVLSPWGEAWSVPFSGITDGLMLVGMVVVHNLAKRETD